MERRKKTIILAASVCILVLSAVSSFAAPGQTRLDPNTLTKYLDPLPVPAVLDGKISQTVTIDEFTQQVLPSDFIAGPYGGKTLVWGYNGSYPGPTIEAERGIPSKVTFENNLYDPALLPLLPIDQTLHWANPLGCDRNDPCAQERYDGPVPVVVHLHGGEVPSAFDGYPEAWFTSGSAIVGPEWVTNTFTYPNTQEATTLWYHDHALGITRLNVYAGLAAFYLLRDPANEPSDLPGGLYEREIVIQDRMFDTNGQLFYPKNDGYGDAPLWVNMFMGDTIVVNGKAWPYLDVEPRRYRLRLLNGSNSRIYTFKLQTSGGQAGPSFWQIGTDGGLLDTPIQLSQITLAPAERADVIVDFTGRAGTSYLLKNSGSSGGSYGSWGGSGSGSSGVSEIMKINVTLPLNGTDTSLNPSTGPNLRPNNPVVQLSSTVTSSTPTRRMTLSRDRRSGEFLLNGRLWTSFVTELPRVGATEVWTFENRTGDTHPIHIHLVQFQVLGNGSYGGSWGGGSWGGSSGGGDPEQRGWKDTVRVGPWDEVSVVVRWAPQETSAGAVQPGQNRFTFDPTATVGTTDAFGFPGGPGYVWHCHILEHEDNEMMRPYRVQP